MSETTKPEDDAAPAAPVYPRAKEGQDDTGHIVTSAGDEPILGTIADITDGDRHKIKHK